MLIHSYTSKFHCMAKVVVVFLGQAWAAILRLEIQFLLN